MPSSESTSIFSGCSRASLDTNLVFVYSAAALLGMSSNLGGPGGGGRAFVYRIRVMKSCWYWRSVLPPGRLDGLEDIVGFRKWCRI